ncbi:Autophagy-related protein 13b, partial [Cucurbita argyrosperma subsp. argyrosperma]
MASSHNTHSETAKVEQILTEFFPKTLQIILESRSPCISSRNFSGDQVLCSPSSSSSSSSSMRPRDKWFNLALRECSATLENIDLWRPSYHEPMVIDVILVQREFGLDSVNASPRKDLVRNLSLKDKHPFSLNSDKEEFGCQTKSEKVVERWMVHYESRKNRDTNSGCRRSSNSTAHTYKKTILLLRSLYAFVRLLPAYKVFQDISSSGQIHPFTLVHRVSSFVEPFTRREEAEMQRFVFTPVDTSCGRLCLSVLYRASLSDISSEPSTPMSPQVIPEYVGSPLTDPLKRFPTLPVSIAPSHGSPSSLQFSRRHSWSYDRFRPSPPSVSFSPSPTYSESHALVSNPAFCRLPPSSLPSQPAEMAMGHKDNVNYDEYYPSPVFSPSPSLSPPIGIPVRRLPNGLLQSESAPQSAPIAKLPHSPALSSKPNLSPSSPLKASGPGIPLPAGSAIRKSFSLGRDESRRISGWRVSSNNSPISRSSSRSFPDDLDDPEFPCPFDVDEDEMTDRGSRPESFDQKGNICEMLEPGGFFPIRKSQDAAVGALVRMLQKAPPLRQDFTDSAADLVRPSTPDSPSRNPQQGTQISKSLGSKGRYAASSSITTSGLFVPKTTADALEELQSYREMKNLLLRQAGKTPI